VAENAEITTRGRVGEEFELLVTLYRALIETKDLSSACSATLQIVCQFTDWDLGLAWLPTPGEKELTLFTAWHRDNSNLVEFVEICQQRSFPPNVGMPGRVWARRKPEWTSNLAAEPSDLFPLAPFAALAGIKAGLGVPVLDGESVLAVLLFYLLEFKEKDTHLIQVMSEVATQLGFALRHKHIEVELESNEAKQRQAHHELEMRVKERTAELSRVNELLQAEIAAREEIEGRAQERVRQQAAVAQLGERALRGVELFTLMDEAIALVAQTLRVEFCKILELLPDGKALLLRAGVGWKEGLVGQVTVGAGTNSQAGYTLLSNEPVIIKDLRTEERFSGPPLLREHGVVSGLSVIIGRRDRPFGVLGAHTAKLHTFTEDDIHFLEAVANVLSQVIENSHSLEEIRRSANWLERLIETTQDAVLSIDRQGRVVMFNAAAERIFGYTRNEIVGQKVNLLMAEPYATEHDGYIEHYERTGEARAIGRIRTVTAKRKNGELFPIELSVTKIAEDQDVQYAAFIRDISEKARLQAQLVENERLVAVGTTAAKIGHELANPLNGMSLTIQLLEQRLSKRSSLIDAQITSTVNRLKNEVSRLSTLLEQFRSLSRREKFDFQRTTLTALVGEAIEIEMPRYAELGIQVECFIPSNLPTITVDIDKMKQVIFNLTKNAAEAMAGGGRISIKGSASENRIVLEISDTGTGIPAGVDIFEPFFTTKPEGTGIGLSIVQQIVSAHGGSITYSSEHGKGTTFVIALPQK
jgi:two-component system, cell cycle sensor histidine kinase and response regulator CckA